MGATPQPNPFGNCPYCSWDGDAPLYVFAVISGVVKPTGIPDYHLYNGLYMLKAVSICTWSFESDLVNCFWQAGAAARLACSVAPFGYGEISEPYFDDYGAPPCSTGFSNLVGAGYPEFLYHDGYAAVYAGFPGAPADWVTDYGFLPEGNWKYEQDLMSSMEQIYLGSRKYKTNCRIKFDPAEM